MGGGKNGRREEWRREKTIRNSFDQEIGWIAERVEVESILTMAPTKTFKELIVWQKAHQFVLKVYAVSSMFPSHEIFGLTSQFRRAAVSIAANIAEGYPKRGLADKRRFLNIAQGSLAECKYYLWLSHDLEYKHDTEMQSLLEEVSRLLNAYSRSLRA